MKNCVIGRPKWHRRIKWRHLFIGLGIVAVIVGTVTATEFLKELEEQDYVDG